MNIRSKWTPLFLSNFLGVFNDNFLKYCIIFIALSWPKPSWLSQSQLISLVSGALVIPYLFLSPLGGWLAVSYSKKLVFRLCKLLEIPVLALACVAFWFQWVMVAVAAVLLMGILSCLYSPSKYSLIRDIGGEEGVSFGSGVFETMAFLGILVGMVAASVVSDYYQALIVFAVLIGLAVLGYFVTSAIRAEELPENKDNHGTLNPVRFLMDSFRFAREHQGVNHAVFGASSFWLIGGMLQMNLLIHAGHIYHSSNTLTGLIIASAAIGIATGTWSAGKLSGKTVRKGLILIGTGSMTMLLLILTLLPVTLPVFVILVFLLAFSGGMFQIPCLSMLQNAGLGRKLGDMIAYLNLVTFIFVLLGTLLFSLTTKLTNENSYAVFGVMAALCASVCFFFLKSSPEYLKQTKSMFKFML